MMRLPCRKSPCTSVTSCGRTGVAVAQPAQRQFEHRPRPIETAVVPLQLGHFLGRRHAAKFRQLRQRQAMDAGQNVAELARQFRPRLRKLVVAQNLPGNGFAIDPLHDEAGAEFILRLKHMQHLRRRHAGLISALHQRRLDIQPGGALRGRCSPAARGAGSRRCCPRDGRYRTTRSPGWRRRRA